MILYQTDYTTFSTKMAGLRIQAENWLQGLRDQIRAFLTYFPVLKYRRVCNGAYRTNSTDINEAKGKRKRQVDIAIQGKACATFTPS